MRKHNDGQGTGSNREEDGRIIIETDAGGKEKERFPRGIYGFSNKGSS